MYLSRKVREPKVNIPWELSSELCIKVWVDLHPTPFGLGNKLYSRIQAHIWMPDRQGYGYGAYV